MGDIKVILELTKHKQSWNIKISTRMNLDGMSTEMDFFTLHGPYMRAAWT